jgi:hypothetical protein
LRKNTTPSGHFQNKIGKKQKWVKSIPQLTYTTTPSLGFGTDIPITSGGVILGI